MGGVRDLAAILESLHNASNREEAFGILNESVKQYGYNNACYTLLTDHPSINQSAQHGLATSYPEDWLKHYNENEYQKNDPVWQRLLKNTTPFFWNDTVLTLKRKNRQDPKTLLLPEKIMREAEEAKVADGAGFSFRGKAGEIAGIGLSRERSENTYDIHDLAELYMVATVFHEKLISTYQVETLPPLTERQLEVLSWAAEGKSDKEIAFKIGITAAAVRFHWNNIFKNMDVNTKLLATTKAIRTGLISPQTFKYSP